jgi:hypothetical protein
MRRVERVAYLDESTVRRFISIDFIVPAAGDTRRPAALAFVPLGLFAKETLTNFDLRAADGHALPMLTSTQNGLLSSAVLLTMGRARLGPDFDSLSETYVPRLVFSDEDTERDLATERILQTGTPAGDRILEKKTGFETLVVDFSDNFMLYLPTDRASVGERLIVKLSYDSPRKAPRLSGVRERLGLAPAPDSFDVPMVGYGGSHHFEIEAPLDMEIVSGAFFAARDNDLVDDSLREPVRRAHFHLGAVDRGYGEVLLALRARGASLLSGAALFTLVNLGALAFVDWRIDQIVKPAGGGTEAAVAALLTVPALILGSLLRAGEHEILSSFLAFPRRAALTSALMSLAAAALLFGGFSGSTLKTIYVVPIVVATVCAAIVGAAWAGNRR